MQRRVLVSVALVALLVIATPLAAAPLEHGSAPSWFAVVVDFFETLLKMGPHADPGGDPAPNMGPHGEPGGDPAYDPFADPGAIPGEKMGPHAEPGGEPEEDDASATFPVDLSVDYGPSIDPSE